MSMNFTMKKAMLLLMAAMTACAMAGCGGSDSSEAATEATTEATTEAATDATTEAATVEATVLEFEDPVIPAEDEAYLAVTDAQWWIQNWGTDESPLCYNQKVAKITGNGSYTVGVDATTAAFHYDTDTGDDYQCEGIGFMAVYINNGEALFPGIVLTVDSIIVDGEEAELVAKNYTSSDDTVVTRTNIYNEWVNRTEVSDGLATITNGRCAEGPFFVDDQLADFISADLTTYSAQVIDPASTVFGSWSTIDVNFTVSGLEDAGAAADTDAADDLADEAETDAAAE